MKKILKINDFYHFRYNPLKEQGWDSRNHCFEGLLRVVKDNKGKFHFNDTYWGLNDSSGVCMTLEEANKNGVLTYYCNLDELEKAEKWDLDYYDEKDIFRLHTQNACVESCVWYFKKLGATRSKERMLEVINKKIKDAHYELQSAGRDVERHVATKTKIENGDLSVYL